MPHLVKHVPHMLNHMPHMPHLVNPMPHLVNQVAVIIAMQGRNVPSEPVVDRFSDALERGVAIAAGLEVQVRVILEGMAR